ncbi:MAG: hypothetical protein ACK4GA_02475 [Acinetobacter sp.]|uniref:hypothetical protein n=1 Tax=Acinetobacter sp. TaxID=472 RepID=UPI003919710F
MGIEFEEVFEIMVKAAEKKFKANWPSIKDYASVELDKIATTIVNIEYLYKSGKISEQEAYILFEMQKNTARSVMLALQGMTLIMVEEVINESLKAIKDLVNGKIGFLLL